MIGLAATALFAGCAKEEGPVDPYSVNWAYLEVPKGTEYTLEFSTLGEWVTSMNEVQKFTRLRCTKPAPSKVTATIAIDESLVAAYNEKNGTSYELLPGAKLEKTTLVIEQGQYASADTIKVIHEGFDEILANGSKSYLLPVTVTSLEGDVTKSEKGTFFVVYEAKELIGRIGYDYVGVELTNKSEWTCTSSEGVNLPKVINGNASDYQWLRSGGGWVDGTEYITIDLGATYKIKSFGLRYYAWYYSTDQYSLFFSVDGENYTDGGNYVNDGNSSLIAEFFAPIEARYIKIWNGTVSYYDDYNYGAVLNEAYVYVAE